MHGVLKLLYGRSLIREQVFAGLQTAKAPEVKLGRLSKINDRVKKAVVLLREKGMGIKQIAKELQIGIGNKKNGLNQY